MTVKRYMTALSIFAAIVCTLVAFNAECATSLVTLNSKATIYHKTSCRYSKGVRVSVRKAVKAGARPCKVCHRKPKAKVIKRKVRKVTVQPLGMSYRMCTPVQRAWLLSDCGSDSY